MKYYHKYLGYNMRLDAVHAAILRVKLPHVADWLTAAQEAARRYDALIEAANLHGFMRRPVAKPDRRHTFNQYVVRVPAAHRDALVKHLKDNGVGVEVYYPLCLHEQECFRHLGYRDRRFPGERGGGRAACWRCRCSRRSPKRSNGADRRVPRRTSASRSARRRDGAGTHGIVIDSLKGTAFLTRSVRTTMHSLPQAEREEGYALYLFPCLIPLRRL